MTYQPGVLRTTDKNQPNGYQGLDASGKATAIPVFYGAGPTNMAGLVPDPGPGPMVAGQEKWLCEDATWKILPGSPAALADLTNQTNSIGNTPVFPGIAQGRLTEVSGSIYITTAGTSGTVQGHFEWQEYSGGPIVSFTSDPIGMTLGGDLRFSVTAKILLSSLNYSVIVTGTPGPLKYGMYFSCIFRDGGP